MITVTGATGQFGRLAIEHLLARDVPAAGIAAVVRDPERAADLAERGVEVRQADYDRPETLPAALRGTDTLLFVSSTGPDDQRIVQHRAVVTAAREARVGLVAYTSLVGADFNTLDLARVHRDTEGALAESGLPTVLLRNGWYTENYTAALADSVARGEIVGAAGDGRIASASRSDLAEAAAIVATSEDQAGRIHELTGDSTWTLPELAAEAARVSGREVAYRDLGGDAYAEVLTGAGLPDFVVSLLVDSDVKVSKGALAAVTGDLPALLGRSTTPLADSVRAALAD
ncbi:SDR family oxidoreductase [Streptomyces spiramenti]|uniref:SDR family oxidoreductase n=1 Tax=Streptomyces spiramenti TaxID=2720606 RepID=A0ABX1APL0_9ACTN|nr:SDR family oxidoreductase [Streptomyces spiramenti]NJP67566.1 SDR family oxidoreductase [Streptomyces spiramenti]